MINWHLRGCDGPPPFSLSQNVRRCRRLHSESDFMLTRFRAKSHFKVSVETGAVILEVMSRNFTVCTFLSVPTTEFELGLKRDLKYSAFKLPRVDK